MIKFDIVIMLNEKAKEKEPGFKVEFDDIVEEETKPKKNKYEIIFNDRKCICNTRPEIQKITNYSLWKIGQIILHPERYKDISIKKI